MPQQLLERPPNFFVRHRKFLIFGLLGLLILVAIAAGIYYYYKNRSYSEEETLSLIQKNILPSIVQIRCSDSDGGPEASIGTGAYVVDSSGTPWIETNAHVVLGSDGQYHGCNVYFPRPEDGSFYDSAYVTGDPYLYHNLESVVNDETVSGLDYAELPLTGSVTDQPEKFPFPPTQSDIYKTFDKICKTGEINIGDKVYIIGYPAVGGSSLTLTDGVVSGFSGDFDQWIKVSANTNRGNSGGIAVGASNGCYYGIVTKATFEKGGNLGLVLDGHFIRSFTAGLTGNTTYAPPSEKETSLKKYLTQPYEFPDFYINYPEEWDFATSTPDTDQSYYVAFTSPLESAIDKLKEQMTVFVTPNASENSLTKLIGDIKKNIDSNDPYAKKARYVTLDGVKTYQIIESDDSLQIFPVPVLAYRIIFLYRGVLYDLLSISEDGVNANAFLNLFAAMGDSIKFK